MPRLTASNATAAGSPPSGPRTTSAPTRPAQVASWSAAAARNVSAAPSTTERPSATSTRAILPQVVVLPEPFTPTTRSTAGRSPCGVDLQRPVRGRVERLDQLLGEHVRAARRRSPCPAPGPARAAARRSAGSAPRRRRRRSASPRSRPRCRRRACPATAAPADPGRRRSATWPAGPAAGTIRPAVGSGFSSTASTSGTASSTGTASSRYGRFGRHGLSLGRSLDLEPQPQPRPRPLPEV